MRDKLIELIGFAPYGNRSVSDCFFADTIEGIADYLIANGVTFADVPDTNVGKWIPVSERLPKERRKYLVWGEIPVRDNIYHFADVQVFSPDSNAFVIDGMKSDCITHWMPIEPPKEGE